MHIIVLHNQDADLLEDDPGREAREDVVHVAKALCDALTQGDTTAEPVAVGAQPVGFVAHLEQRKPDLVVNLCESVAGDSRGEMMVPSLLEVLGVPYTGSSSLSLGLALHKNKAKELLSARGVATPGWKLVRDPEDILTVDLPFPLIVKPSREDASVGIDFDSVVEDRQALARVAKKIVRHFGQPALVERYIPGKEVYVPLLGNRPRKALPLSEIHFGAAFKDRPQIVSYKAKWETSSPECVDSPSGPCTLDVLTSARVVKTAIAAFDALECRDYGRVDIRVSSDGEPFVIDINPNCDLHPQAGFAKAARQVGLSYTDLAQRLVEIALERSHGNTPHRTSRQTATFGPASSHRNVLTGRSRVRARAHRSRAHAE